MPTMKLADPLIGRWNLGFGWHGVGPQSPGGSTLDADYSYTLSLTVVDANGLLDGPAAPGAWSAPLIAFDLDFDVSVPGAAVPIPPLLAHNVPSANLISPAERDAPGAAAASVVVGPFIQLGPAPSSGDTNTVQKRGQPA